MLSARKQLDVITAYQRVGSYRGAAEICGVTHKTVKRVIERERAQAVRVERRRNFESVRGTVAHEMTQTHGKISAKRLLPIARAAGYEGSDRNFRRPVATERAKYRQGQAIAAGRRPAVWAPGEHLVIDWGVLNGLHVFCAVLAYSRVRFVRFATDEKASTTLALLAECFETLGAARARRPRHPHERAAGAPTALPSRPSRTSSTSGPHPLTWPSSVASL